MRFRKTVLGIYQALLVIVLTILVIIVIFDIFTSRGHARYHWNNIFLVSLFILPTIIFCSCNSVKMLVPKPNLFKRWKSLTQISIVFATLCTVLFGYLLIFETFSGSCQTSVSRTSSLQTGRMAPDFSIRDQLGNAISLSKLRGKIVLLDFWGVWCGPCRQKLPHTQKIYDQFKNKGLTVIGIHSAFQTKGMAAFIAENNYTFPTGIDTGHIAKDYGVTGWPTYYLINRQGRLAWGPRHAPPSEKLIESLLKD